ncbi:hypothetical protein B484DRAFT_55096 [Ochromonadaceae sp. CCMP2298]|nr:hypothetical protein B484DRAFT_55096 [Ochromonadaceae sp. CCMP2298]|mmetsp:Transcript_13335/g.29205  ORF Transcript_13335/g.29205 Transcript_13335/m.29205 type:complete len:232 (+) Transcript_13335:1068-1763(+)
MGPSKFTRDPPPYALVSTTTPTTPTPSPTAPSPPRPWPLRKGGKSSSATRRTRWASGKPPPPHRAHPHSSLLSSECHRAKLRRAATTSTTLSFTGAAHSLTMQQAMTVLPTCCAPLTSAPYPSWFSVSALCSAASWCFCSTSVETSPLLENAACASIDRCSSVLPRTKGSASTFSTRESNPLSTAAPSALSLCTTLELELGALEDPCECSSLLRASPGSEACRMDASHASQ